VLAENADRRLRAPDDLEGMTDLPLLATIAPSAFSRHLDTGPADDESFQMLRTALLYSNPDQNQRTVVITSAGEREGKTTVATRLALAAARAGMRVVLVDADLRRAQVGSRLGITAKEGLGAVLAGGRSPDEVVLRYPIDDPGAVDLGVMPAGTPQAKPAALISAQAMRPVLEKLYSWFDLVVIDTPAALMVSDPIPLMELANDVILVARMDQTRRERIRRVQRMITAAHGNLVGVVATGVSAGIGYEYYRSEYYTTNGKDHGGRLGRRGNPRAPAS
jgi:capsular exopolysaccharide synthesis family protein